MFGWFSEPSALASRMNRFWKSGSSAIFWGRILRAIMRSSVGYRAL
jgi:hypothetical protein